MSETNPEVSASQAEGSAVDVVPKQYLLPFILVTSLFALWGFANDITNPLVEAFKQIFLIDNSQSSLVQFAFYGGYATMAIPAALVIRKLSFKAGILIGLALYAVGALLFIPAAMSMQFTLFLVALYILTFGLAFLETSANPYILSMGPEETATRRLNLAQAFNPIGSLTGMFIASMLVLPSLEVSQFRANEITSNPEYNEMLPGDVDAKVTAALENFRDTEPEAHQAMQAADLGTIRIPYVVIALVVLGILGLFIVTKMPSTGHTEEPIKLGQLLSNLATFRYIGGVVAQAFYVGAQIVCWTFIIRYGIALLGMDAATAQQYNIGAMCCFLASRFLFTYLLKFIDSAILLMVLAVIGIVLCLGTIYVQGYPGIYCLMAISACMGVMFPTIYGIALDGLTVDDAKLGSAGLVFAIVGGAWMPRYMGAIIDQGTVEVFGSTLDAVRASFLVPMICFVVIAVYALIMATVGRRKA